MPQLWRPCSIRVAVSSAVATSPLFVCRFGAASVGGKHVCFRRRLRLVACVVSISVCVRVASCSPLELSGSKPHCIILCTKTYINILEALDTSLSLSLSLSCSAVHSSCSRSSGSSRAQHIRAKEGRCRVSISSWFRAPVVPPFSTHARNKTTYLVNLT